MADEGQDLLQISYLQSALGKLENYARMGHQINNATNLAHMFIINPFSD